MDDSNDEEIADDAGDTQDGDEQEEDTGDAAADDKSGDGDDDEDDAEGDDAGDGDSDDDAPLPKTRKELNKAIADGVRAALKSNKNRSAADRRTSGKDRLPDKKRPVRNDSRVDEHEKAIGEIRASEAKRQFGYENDLSPDEVDVVFRLSKNPTAKTLRDPIVKGALTGHRDAKAAKKNVPSGNHRPLKTAAGKDQKNLSDRDRDTNLVNRRSELLNRGKR